MSARTTSIVASHHRGPLTAAKRLATEKTIFSLWTTGTFRLWAHTAVFVIASVLLYTPVPDRTVIGELTLMVVVFNGLLTIRLTRASGLKRKPCWPFWSRCTLVLFRSWVPRRLMTRPVGFRMRNGAAQVAAILTLAHEDVELTPGVEHLAASRETSGLFPMEALH